MNKGRRARPFGYFEEMPVTDETRLLAAEAAEAHSILSWVGAIALLAGGVVIVWKGGFAADRDAMPFWIWIFPLVFGLTGLSLLKKMSRTALDRMRYGEVMLRLHGRAHPGGRLTGTIAIRSAGRIGHFKATLSCEETVWYLETSKNTEGESESHLNSAQSSLWTETSRLEPNSAGQLGVEFKLPPDLPFSTYPGDFGVSRESQIDRKYWRWLLRLRADGETIDLRRTFVIPVETSAPGSMTREVTL